MKIMKIRKFLKIKYVIIIAVILFIIYNFIWYFTVSWTYDRYKNDMEPEFEGLWETVTHRAYSALDEEYAYYLKYPAYLYFTGNLAAGTPDGSNTLIIWPSFWGKEHFKYGATIRDGNEIYQIMVDRQGNAINANDQAIIDQNREQVEVLFSIAEKRFAI